MERVNLWLKPSELLPSAVARAALSSRCRRIISSELHY